MRHKRLGRKLGVTTKQRKSMFRNMVTDLFRYDRLKTTDTRAKELRRVAEKMITLAKEGSLHKRRQAGAYIRDKEVLRKLFDEIAEKFKDRPGGYTRIIKLGFRKGDNSPISLIELVEEDYKPKKKKKAPAKAKQPKAAQEKTKSSKKESAEELGLIEEEAAGAAETPETESQAETEAEAKEAPEAEEESAEDASVEETTEEPEAKAEDSAAEQGSAEEASGAGKETEKKDT